MMATKIIKERLNRPKVNLVDFTVFSIPEKLIRSRRDMFSRIEQTSFTQEDVDLMARAVYGSKVGVGDVAGVAPGMKRTPMDFSYDAAIEEWELIAFDVVAGLLDKLGLRPSDIDIVITTSSTLTSIPSLSARICNKFSMRKDTQNFSLGGHGCSGGIAAIDIAKHILMSAPEKRALVVLNENLTAGWYDGHYKPFLLSNMLFRLGGAALLLSNRKVDKRTAKYSLRHVVRSINTTDGALECVKMTSDPEAKEKRGVQINGKTVVGCASVVLQDVLTRLAPLVLPLSELLKVAKDPKHKADFSKAFQHVVIHPGAVKVIDGVRSALGFGDKASIPSLQTLNRFGNTSSSSTLYILANVESRIGVKKGDNVLQLAMGSGFKAAAATWQARRDINEVHPAWQGDPRVFVPVEEDPYAQKYQRASDDINLMDLDISEERK